MKTVRNSVQDFCTSRQAKFVACAKVGKSYLVSIAAIKKEIVENELLPYLIKAGHVELTQRGGVYDEGDGAWTTYIN